MNDDVSIWTAVKRVALGCAPQWWFDMLVGRALRTRVLGEAGDWRRCSPTKAKAELDALKAGMRGEE